MKDESFTILAMHLKKTSGLILRRDQDYLLTARLSPLLEIAECVDIDDLAARLVAHHDPILSRYVTEAMATHETSFLRDAKIFAYLKQTILPAVMQRNQASKHLRLWSAGCSTGQEPYSLAMLIRQDDALRDWTVDIVATDLSHEAIRRAQSGVFSHFEAQRGLPIGYLMRFFTRHDQDWHIEDPIKRMVSFRTRNMLDDFSDLGSFDIVFCRNVLIYIDTALKDDIVTRLHRVVRPHGYLVLGAVEAYLNNASWQDQAAITGIFRRL